MDAVHPDSLSATLNMIDESFFYHLAFTPQQRGEMAKWVAARPLSAVNMPSPSRCDYEQGVRLFTGERLHTRLSVNHVLGVEACRMLRLIGTVDMWENAEIRRARKAVVQSCFARGCVVGECAYSTVAFWRFLAANGLGIAEETHHYLAQGMETLAQYRDGKGRWKRFPFYYTLLALLEMPAELADTELNYALPALKRRKRGNLENRYEQRRRDLADRAVKRLGYEVALPGLA